jgi:3-oxoacyl-[acyl-carrier protein] reductase
VPPLDGKVALITGAGRGIGRQYALRLAALGADIALCDADLHAARAVGEELSADTVGAEVRVLGRDSFEMAVDVTRREEMEAFFAAVDERFGRVDVVVCNAGGLFEPGDKSWAASVPMDLFEATMARNLMGTIHTCQLAAPLMLRNGWGKVVTVASVGAFRASDRGWYTSYGVAKAGVIAYTLYLAEELGPAGITVNAIAPGYIGTHRVRAAAVEPAEERVSADTPLGRPGTPEDCAGVIEFLCTPLSDFVTGQVIVVDGGATIRRHATRATPPR